MSGEPNPTVRQITERAAIAAGAELLSSQATGAPFNPASVVATLGEGFLERHRNKTAQFVGAIVDEVGEDALRAALERDPERDALMFSALDAVIRSGLEQKRIMLAKVVANAMTSDEPIDEAQLIVAALQELDGPHIRALARIRDADDRNQADAGIRDDILDEALEREPMPVLAALVRAGVVFTGSVQREDGLFSIPNPKTYSITGVNDFGRRLLVELQGLSEHQERMGTH